MLEILQKNWWMFGLRGVASIAFGLLALLWPGLTLTVMIGFFGGYAIVDGAFSLVSGLRHRHEGGRTWLLISEGILGLLVGGAAWAWPAITALSLVTLIAVWAVLTGGLEVAAAIRLRREIEGEWWLAASGVTSIAFGVLLLMRPSAGALALLWLIGIYALMFGVLFIGLSLWLRVARRETPTMAMHA